MTILRFWKREYYVYNICKSPTFIIGKKEHKIYLPYLL